MRTAYYFSSRTCIPCKTFKPIFKQVASQAGITVSEVDVDSNGSMVQQLGISKVPTIVLTDALTNKELKRHSGAMSAPALLQFLKY